jgi:hypothetical protein
MSTLPRTTPPVTPHTEPGTDAPVVYDAEALRDLHIQAIFAEQADHHRRVDEALRRTAAEFPWAEDDILCLV